MRQTHFRPRSGASFLWSAAALVLLSGCMRNYEEVTRFAPLESARIAAPDDAPPGSCWAQDVTPAVVETVTAQVMVSPPVEAPDGTVIEPARFATETHQQIVQPRQAFQFETVCAEDITPQFVASLQRALQARAYYLHAITGQFDPQTDAALRAYQRDNGLQTGFLTIQTAREFGLAPALW